MSAAPAACASCARLRPPEELDPQGWCAACRGAVVRRATLWGRVAGVAAGALAGVLIFGVLSPARFLVFWVVLVVAVYVFTTKLVRRVAFEVIRGRGVTAREG